MAGIRRVALIHPVWTVFLLLILFHLSLCMQARVVSGAEEVKEVTLIGLNNCQACGGKPSEPGAKCSPFGHSCTFSVEKATDEEGKEIEELKKRELSYKLNQQSLPLLKEQEFLGARLEVKGKWLRERGAIEVSSFRRLEK